MPESNLWRRNDPPYEENVKAIFQFPDTGLGYWMTGKQANTLAKLSFCFLAINSGHYWDSSNTAT